MFEIWTQCTPCSATVGFISQAPRPSDLPWGGEAGGRKKKARVICNSSGPWLQSPAAAATPMTPAPTGWPCMTTSSAHTRAPIWPPPCTDPIGVVSSLNVRMEGCSPSPLGCVCPPTPGESILREESPLLIYLAWLLFALWDSEWITDDEDGRLKAWPLRLWEGRI